jgi:branched-chain amino acid transport system permease protein
VRDHLKKVALILIALLLILLPWMIDKYSLQLIIYIMTYTMLTLGFSICWKSRLIRVDLAGYWGIGAYATGMLMAKAGWSYWPTILIGGLVAALIAWGVGSLTLPRGGLVFFAFSMLVGLLIQQTLAAVKVFGGWAGIENIPPPAIGSFVFKGKTEYYFLGLFLLAINYVAYYLLYNSKIGRAWTVIGSSVGLAQSLGINVVRYRLSAVVLSSFFCAVSGSYLASYQMYIIPDSFSFQQSITIQMYGLLGGLNYYLAGPVVGTTITTFVSEYLKVTAEIEPILTAAAILIVIIFMPSGFLGMIVKLWGLSFFSRIRSKIGGVTRKWRS